VQRNEYHQEINDFQQRMATQESKRIYRQRSEVAETPHLKAKFGLRQFHVRTGESRTGSALDRADLQRRFAAALPEAG